MLLLGSMDRYSVHILGRLEKALDTLDFRWVLRLLAEPKKTEEKKIEGDRKTDITRHREQIDWVRIRNAGDALTRLKIYAMSAEIYDYFGKYAEAREKIEEDGILSEKDLRAEVEKDGNLSERTLPDNPKEKEEERALLKQKVWILIHWSMTFYRGHNYKRARELLLLGNEALNKRIITDSDPCAFTQSRIYYSLGLIQRQVYDYKSARQWFTKSIEMAWESFVRKTKNVPMTDPIYKRTKILTGFYVAKSLALGLAWTYYTEGALQLASSLVGTARLLLVDTNEVVIRSYIEILSASIVAAQGKRQEAIDILERAYLALKEHDHEAYRIRAANELAVAYVHEFVREGTLTNRTKAREYINQVKKFSDIRWESNALITESRLFRAMGNFKSAEDSAKKALSLGGEQRFVKIDALIARGEARLALNKIDEACKDFTDALMNGSDNRKVQVVCHLHLARAYLLKDDHSLALRHRTEAARDIANVDNAFVRNLAETVESMITQSTGADFFIPFSAAELNPWELEKRLHIFLAKWAKHKAGSENEPWKVLGISKQTFYNWKPNGELSRESMQSASGEREE